MRVLLTFLETSRLSTAGNSEETMMRAVTIRATVSVVACAFALVAVLSQNAASQAGSSRPLVSETQYEAWQTELSNWGRWGRDDQLGNAQPDYAGQAPRRADAG